MHEASLWLEHAPSVGHAIGPRQEVHCIHPNYVSKLLNVFFLEDGTYYRLA